MSKDTFNNWVTCPRPQSEAKVRLFCLPFAGGGASLYRPWTTQLAPHIEVCPIQLPARENRYSEKAITDAYEMARTIASQMIPFINGRYAIFGHSMGALLAFEISRELARLNANAPERLFVSAHRAPHLPRKRALLHALPDNEFIESLKQYGGFPEEILNNQEFIEFVLPTMRSDMTLCDLYAYKNRDERLTMPVEIFAGSEDLEAGPDQMQAWSEHTLGGSRMKIFDGGHFFLRSHSKELLEQISNSLNLVSNLVI